MQQDYENVMECYEEMSEEGRAEFDKLHDKVRGVLHTEYLRRNRLSKANLQWGEKSTVELIGALMRKGYL